MKLFSFDRFTGVIAIGSLVLSAVALLVHSFVDIKPFVSNLVSSSVWEVFVSIPIIVLSYLAGIITVKFSTFAFSRYRKESTRKRVTRFIEVGRVNNELFANKYEILVQELELLQGAFSAMFLLGFVLFLKVLRSSPDIGGTLPYGKLIFGVVAAIFTIVIPALLAKIISKIYQELLELIKQVRQIESISEGIQGESKKQ